MRYSGRGGKVFQVGESLMVRLPENAEYAR